MISQNPDLMFLIVWSVALASVVGAAICFAITPGLARLTRIPFGIIAAPLILIMVLGAYQSTSTIGDIFMLFALGALGWMMKHADWPRAPALVGFVLAKPMEQYFWLANQIHGWSWLLRPGVLIIAALIVLPPLLRLWRRRNRPAAAPEAVEEEAFEADPPAPHQANPTVSLVLALLVSAIFLYAGWETLSFNPSSRMMPALALIPGTPLALWLVYRALQGFAPARDEAFDEAVILAVLIGYAVAIWALGFSLPTVALLAWMLWRRARMRLVTGLLYGAVVFFIVFELFGMLRGDAPVGVLTGWS
jgi:hypothetical protein